VCELNCRERVVRVTSYHHLSISNLFMAELEQQRQRVYKSTSFATICASSLYYHHFRPSNMENNLSRARFRAAAAAAAEREEVKNFFCARISARTTDLCFYFTLFFFTHSKRGDEMRKKLIVITCRES
jgi:hypothetical protein